MRAGLTAKTYLLDVISGQKPLSRKSLFDFSRAMELNKKETEYFETLVSFNNSKSGKEKDFYWEKVKALAGKTGAKEIGVKQMEYFSKWYHAAVRELVTLKSFRGNLDRFA